MSSPRPMDTGEAAAGGRPSADSRASVLATQRTALALRLLAVVLGGVALGLPYVHHGAFPLSWIAFVPLLWALERRGLLAAYLFGVVMGTAAWAVGTNWIAEFIGILKGYAVPWNWMSAAMVWLWAGQFHGLAALAYQWLRRHTGAPAVLLFPVLFVAAEAAYPQLFAVKVGESQAPFLVGIQGIDLVGILGLDFIICLTSAVIYMLLWGRISGRDGVAVGCALAVLAAWFAYGIVRLDTWDDRISTWTRTRTRSVGVVQPNDVPSVKIPPPPEGYSRRRPPEMDMTRALAAEGAELVVWPETRYKGYYASAQVRLAYSRQLREMGTALLFHDLERVRREVGFDDYNTAVVLSAEGETVGDYRKIKRVAFGEYVPVLSEVPFLRRWIEQYFGDFTREITPGDGHRTLRAAGMRLVPKICYEASFPAFVGEAIGRDAAGKVLVVMSNDGWFGRTNQPSAHLRVTALRAVENRVPMIHAINGGPSGAVLPNGRFVARSEAFTRGTLMVDMPYSASSGGSFHSRHPRVFNDFLYAAALGLLGWGWVSRRRSRRFAGAP
ncbi:apolipoprotein N-acyltransferase [Ectothiorhodospiraceae bacterium WFHF3C12]|nr:apolipoprotein N-acyltransferase [Ectothiorhodospiraceae bacterium WFHF3C12]